MVVHGADGLDEITLTGPTAVVEVRGTTTRSYDFVPEELRLARAPAEALKGAESTAGNAEIVEAIIRSTDHHPFSHARRDVVALNAAACLVVAEVATDLKDGLARAMAALESGTAASLLEKLRAFARDTATAPGQPHPTTSF
jgi:anthranilate phosphoribosyltransferase